MAYRIFGAPRTPPERYLQAFLRALAEKNYVQGRNYVLISQWGDGRIARLPELAVTLVNDNVDIIVTEGTLSVRALHAVTATVPIVMTGVADPYVFGIVKDLSRPAGNITSFSNLEIEIAGKQLEQLKEMVPRLDRVAILAARQIWPLFSSAQNEAAKKLAIDITYVDQATGILPTPQCEKRFPRVRMQPCCVVLLSFHLRSGR